MVICPTFAVVAALIVVYLTISPKQYQATSVVDIPLTSDAAAEMEFIKDQEMAESVINEPGLYNQDESVSEFSKKLVVKYRDRWKIKQPGSSEVIEIPAQILEITLYGRSPLEAKRIANCVANTYVESFAQKRMELLPGGLFDDLIKRIEDKLGRMVSDPDPPGESPHEYAITGLPHAAAGLKAGILEMETERGILKERHTDSYPRVIHLESCIAACKSKLEQNEKEAVEVYARRLGLTESAAQSLFERESQAALAEICRRVMDDHLLPDCPCVISAAEGSNLPARPRVGLVLLFGFVMGVSVSIGLSLLISRRHET